METFDANTDATAGTRLGATVVGIGLLAALGSILVLVGLTDVLAYLGGYRPSHWMVLDYVTAFVVTAVGWSLLTVAVLGTARAVRAVR